MLDDFPRAQTTALTFHQARVVRSEPLTCADFVRLATCEKSTFHQLVSVAATSDEAIGRYQEPTLSHMFAEEEADRVVQQHHLQVFSWWLCLSLEQQTADVTCF